VAAANARRLVRARGRPGAATFFALGGYGTTAGSTVTEGPTMKALLGGEHAMGVQPALMCGWAHAMIHDPFAAGRGAAVFCDRPVFCFKQPAGAPWCGAEQLAWPEEGASHEEWAAE
jgi:hypothetical protein